jgi:hypothetical protein
MLLKQIYRYCQPSQSLHLEALRRFFAMNLYADVTCTTNQVV